MRPVTEAHRVEAAFRIPGYRGLWLDTRQWHREAENFFTACAARTPENLLNHVQRIFHHLRYRNRDRVYGALLDLFIVLDTRGRPLKARMLHYARPVLAIEQYDRLHQALDRNDSLAQTSPPDQYSVLSRNFAGSHRLVEKAGASREPGLDSLTLSRSHMEYGQLDAARMVLESAVLDGSNDPEIHKDLIEIYRRSHDKPRFRKVYQQLKTDQGPLLNLWHALDEFFRSAPA